VELHRTHVSQGAWTAVCSGKSDQLVSRAALVLLGTVAYRQRNRFEAGAKQTTSHAPNTPTCGATCAMLPPWRMFMRSASITAVSGKALMNGCSVRSWNVMFHKFNFLEQADYAQCR